MDELNKVDDVKTNDAVKYSKLWYVEFIKGGEDYQIKKISEHKSEVIGYNPNTNKITFKEGTEIASFKTFKEAAIVAIARKISKKKEKWDEVISESYKINEEIGDLLDKLHTLKGIQND